MKKKMIKFAIFTFLITILTITTSYGLYETNGKGDANFEVGKWEILLNSKDISIEKEITLNSFKYNNIDHIEEGYFAPGSKGELEIIIDATNISTACVYSINIDKSDLVDYPNLKFKIINEVSNIELEDTYEGEIQLNDENKKISFKLTIEWENDDDFDTNDIKVIENNIKLLMNMHFTQK